MGKAWESSSVATAVIHYYEGKQEALFNRIIPSGTFYTLRNAGPFAVILESNDDHQKISDYFAYVLRLSCK